MIAKLHFERARRTWNGLLRYANSDATSPECGKSLRSLIFACSPWLEDSGPSWTQFFYTPGAFDPTLIHQGREEEELQSHAASHQQQIRDVLAWFVDPAEHPNLREKVVRFLNSEGCAEKQKLEAYPGFLDEEDTFPKMPFMWDVRYSSMIAPVAVFLLEQYRLFHSGTDFRAVFPVAQCQRRECGKFMLAERPRRKRYCSNVCGVFDRQRDRSREEWAAYVWLHRMEKLKPTSLLKRKLKQKKAADRLKQIPEQWPQLGPKVKKIRDRAGL